MDSYPKINHSGTNGRFLARTAKKSGRKRLPVHDTISRKGVVRMKIALVDDDASCLSEMERICRTFGVQQHCAIEPVRFSSAESFLASLPDEGLSLVFLDVYMHGMGGVEAAQRLRETGSSCLIVFLTSSAAFMPEAFACHAFEYVTKPFTAQRIEGVLRDALKTAPRAPEYLEVLWERRVVRVLLDQIISAAASGHYLNLGLADGHTLRPRMTLADFREKTRGDARFLDVNKGIVLNADYILDFANDCCILENGARFPIRLRDKRKIEQAVLDYRFEMIRRSQYHERTKDGEATV